jgi:hypothetical protein
LTWLAGPDGFPAVGAGVFMPFFAFGFFTFKGMRFEELVKAMCNMWFRPQIRVYEDADGIFQQLHEEIIEQKIVRQRIDSGEYEEVEE